MLKTAFRNLLNPYLTLIKSELNKTSSVFLDKPSHISETELYLYIGWSENGLIRRQTRADASTKDFKSSDFAADWSNRENLGYV